MLGCGSVLATGDYGETPADSAESFHVHCPAVLAGAYFSFQYNRMRVCCYLLVRVWLSPSLSLYSYPVVRCSSSSSCCCCSSSSSSSSSSWGGRRRGRCRCPFSSSFPKVCSAFAALTLRSVLRVSDWQDAAASGVRVPLRVRCSKLGTHHRHKHRCD